jgi:hypothetical protein
MTASHSTLRTSIVLALLAAAALLAGGCASTPGSGPGGAAAPAPSDAYRSVLTHPERMRPVAGNEFAREWIDPAVDFGKFRRVAIERVRVRLDPDSSSVDPAELAALTDYFRKALVTALEPTYPVVTTTGGDVLRVRITLVDLVSTKPAVSLAVLVVPYASVPDIAVSAAAGGPMGSAPYLGRTGIAVEFIDGGTNAVVAQFADTNFGRKFVLDQGGDVSKTVSGTVDGYVDSFSTWAYAQKAFDGWARLFRQRLDAANARKPS